MTFGCHCSFETRKTNFKFEDEIERKEVLDRALYFFVLGLHMCSYVCIGSCGSAISEKICIILVESFPESRFDRQDDLLSPVAFSFD